MRISDWSSDVCSSDLSDYDDLVRLSGVSQTICEGFHGRVVMCSDEGRRQPIAFSCVPSGTEVSCPHSIQRSCIFPSGLRSRRSSLIPPRLQLAGVLWRALAPGWYSRSEEHTSELQSLMRISYAVFCLKK